MIRFNIQRFVRATVTAVVATSIFSVAGIQAAVACGTPPPQPPDVWVTFHTPTRVWIVFHGYTSFGTANGGFCACSLNQAGTILAVRNVRFIDPTSGSPIPGFAFAPNSATGIAFNGAAGAPPAAAFQGFFATVSQAIPQGLPIDIQFDVDVAAGTTLAQLAADLQGANVLGTDEGTSTGGLAGTHLNIVAAGAVMQQPPAPPPAVPTISQWGLMILALLLLAGGTIVTRRMTVARTALA